MKFKVIYDNEKPYTELYFNEEDLKKGLKDFYLKNKDNSYFDVAVFDKDDKDISETQFIEELIGSILPMKCLYCKNEEGVYLYAILNNKEVYDCPKCHKRTIKNELKGGLK